MQELPEHTAHLPVLHQEVIDHWLTDISGKYIDGTFGRGGHSLTLLQSLSSRGQLMGVDRDPEAISAAKQMAKQYTNLIVQRGRFSEIKRFAAENDWLGKVDGILLDLGVSSPQLDTAERGFSFLRQGELDMRMDPDNGISAKDWLNRAEIAEMTDVFKVYGEEKFGKRIATAIHQYRQSKPLETTLELVDIIEQALPILDKHKHPATRTFQAIRMYINQEMQEVEKFLADCLDVLKPGGRLAIISFHSLEDRLIKRFIRNESRGDQFPSSVPVPSALLNKRVKKVGKAIRASETELASNPRSRSAILRVAEKL